MNIFTYKDAKLELLKLGCTVSCNPCFYKVVLPSGSVYAFDTADEVVRFAIDLVVYGEPTLKDVWEDNCFVQALA